MWVGYVPSDYLRCSPEIARCHSTPTLTLDLPLSRLIWKGRRVKWRRPIFHRGDFQESL